MITKIDRICRKNAISSSADPRTPRLLTSNMHVHVHICNIYSAYIYVFTVLFIINIQYVIIVGYRGKIPGAHSNPIYLVNLVLKPPKLQNY